MGVLPVVDLFVRFLKLIQELRIVCSGCSSVWTYLCFRFHAPAQQYCKLTYVPECVRVSYTMVYTKQFACRILHERDGWQLVGSRGLARTHERQVYAL